MSNEYRTDYPSEPIGGGNPYYCCSFCKISDPQINGRLEGHDKYCTWRVAQESKLKFDSSKGCFPRKMWAYLSPTGELLPSTIREREGDSDSCLKKGNAKYRHNINDCIKVNVLVDVIR